ncbi:hypothetical protein Hdeb2414_s0080g00779811 [Helianthus debilis subsp. tardiflorus]
MAPEEDKGKRNKEEETKRMIQTISSRPEDEKHKKDVAMIRKEGKELRQLIKHIHKYIALIIDWVDFYLLAISN